MKDLTPIEAAAMSFTGGGRHAATALEAFTGQDLARALEYAIVMRLDGRRAEAELRELTGTAKPPTASMSTVQARQLARHLKAALLPLRAADDIAEPACIDLDADPDYGNNICRVLRGASEAVEDADIWATRNAAANGCGEETWAGERWCSEPDGALPQV
jgi:hypothetical protein